VQGKFLDTAFLANERNKPHRESTWHKKLEIERIFYLAEQRPLFAFLFLSKIIIMSPKALPRKF